MLIGFGSGLGNFGGGLADLSELINFPPIEARIPGILDAPEIVILGGSAMSAAFDANGVAKSQLRAYAAAAGFTGTLRQYVDSSDTIDAAAAKYQQARTDVAASEGENLYLVHVGGDDIGSFRPDAEDVERFGTRYADLMETIAATDKVIPIPLTKRLYPEAPTVVHGNPATDVNGTLPYNEGALYPILETYAPDWSSGFFTSTDLPSRLSISMTRSSVVAGEAVFLRVEGLSEEEAGLWGFIWDFGSLGEFRFIQGLPHHMRQKNRATGFQQVMAWDSPGMKTVRVQVIPPVSTGLKGTVLSVEVEIRDPESEYAGRTWVVDPDGDFTDAPDGFQVVDWRTANIGARGAGGGRILFRRGKKVPMNASNGSERGFRGAKARPSMLGAWGPGADEAILDVSESGFALTSSADNPEAVLIRDIALQGDYDPVTGNGQRTNAIRVRENMHLTLNGVTCRGNISNVTTITSNTPIANSIIAFDCNFENHENYGLYITDSEYFGARGCFGGQSPLAVNGHEAKEPGQPGNQPDHGFIRCSYANNIVVSQTRGFSSAGWSPTTDNIDGGRVRAHQGFIRLGSSRAEGSYALIADNWTEGAGLNLNGGGNGRLFGAARIVVANNYLIGSANGGGGAVFGHSGVWFHNNLIVVPDVPHERNKPRTVFSWDNDPEGVTDAWASRPIRIFGNTVAYMMSPDSYPLSEKIPPAESVIGFEVEFKLSHLQGLEHPQLTFTDNLFWAPNIILQGDTEPKVPDGIYSAGIWGPTPLYQGYRQEQPDGSIVFDTQYATPADASILPVLSDRSACRSAGSTELSAALDFFARPRASVPCLGAIQKDIAPALAPPVNPYELADRFPDFLEGDGIQGHGTALARYILARVAGHARGLDPAASRTGKTFLYSFLKGSPDDMEIGTINRFSFEPGYVNKPLLCGAVAIDGSFDPYLTLHANVEYSSEAGTSASSETRIADERFHDAQIIGSGIAVDGDQIWELELCGLTPGDLLQVKCVGVSDIEGFSQVGEIVFNGQTLLLDATADADSNMVVFDPVTVPTTGILRLSLSVASGAETACLHGLLMDFL